MKVFLAVVTGLALGAISLACGSATTKTPADPTVDAINASVNTAIAARQSRTATPENEDSGSDTSPVQIEVAGFSENLDVSGTRPGWRTVVVYFDVTNIGDSPSTLEFHGQEFPEILSLHAPNGGEYQISAVYRDVSLPPGTAIRVPYYGEVPEILPTISGSWVSDGLADDWRLSVPDGIADFKQGPAFAAAAPFTSTFSVGENDQATCTFLSIDRAPWRDTGDLSLGWEIRVRVENNSPYDVGCGGLSGMLIDARGNKHKIDADNSTACGVSPGGSKECAAGYVLSSYTIITQTHEIAELDLTSSLIVLFDFPEESSTVFLRYDGQ